LNFVDPLAFMYVNFLHVIGYFLDNWCINFSIY